MIKGSGWNEPPQAKTMRRDQEKAITDGFGDLSIYDSRFHPDHHERTAPADLFSIIQEIASAFARGNKILGS